MFYHVRNSPSPILPAFGYSTIMPHNLPDEKRPVRYVALPRRKRGDVHLIKVVQRCTVHKHRNLLAHAPKKLHDEISADYTDMIYGKTVKDIEARRKAFVRKWRLKCPAVAASLEEAGANLFTFLLYPPDQWKSIRTTNAIERLHEEFKRRIKTQCLLPCAETACMLFWALLASGQITLRRVDGWDTLHVAPADEPLDLVA